MDNVFLRPGRSPDGTPLLVRDPLTRAPLAEAGEWKSNNEFWRRRVRDGDVIDETAQLTATPPSSPAVAPPPEKAAAAPAKKS
jgi:hypothetical protein